MKITIRYITYRIKQKNTKHTTVYTMIKNKQKNIKEYDKRKRNKSSKLHVMYISSNNVRHPVTKTFTTLQYISPNYTSLHFTILFVTSLPPI